MPNKHAFVAAGQVVYTGSSSLDIRLTLGQTHRHDPSITALVTFVARDPATGSATRVNPLVPTTDEERRWYAERKEVARARKAARAAAAAAPDGPAGGRDEAATRRAWSQRLLTEARAMRTMPGAHACDAKLPGACMGLAVCRYAACLWRFAHAFTRPHRRKMSARDVSIQCTVYMHDMHACVEGGPAGHCGPSIIDDHSAAVMCVQGWRQGTRC